MVNPFAHLPQKELEQQQQDAKHEQQNDVLGSSDQSMPPAAAMPALDYEYHRSVGSRGHPPLVPIPVANPEEYQRMQEQRKKQEQYLAQAHLQTLAQQAQQEQQQAAHRRSQSVASVGSMASMASSRHQKIIQQPINTDRAFSNASHLSASETAPQSTRSLHNYVVSQQQQAPHSNNTEELDLGYQPMNDADPSEKEQDYSSNPYRREPSQRTETTTNSNHSSTSNSISQRWFALEATREDHSFWQVIKTEGKDLVLTLFHFLRDRHWKKKVLTVVVVVASATVFVDLFFLGHIQTWLELFMVWMTVHPALAIYAFMGIYVLATLLFVPPTLLQAGAGWAFAHSCGFALGIFAATLSCCLGSLIGALCGFWRARYMMRDLIYLFRGRYPIIRAADAALKRDGFRIMLLLRLCPILPFHGLNYLGGITGIKWETFVFSLVGTVPYTVMVVLIGASAQSINEYNQQTALIDGTTTNAYDGSSGGSANDDHVDTDLEFLNQKKIRQELGMIVVFAFGAATFLIAMILAFRFTGKELRKELNIGDGEMVSYIKTVRRMSMIDLYRNGDLDDEGDSENISDQYQKHDTGEDASEASVELMDTSLPPRNGNPGRATAAVIVADPNTNAEIQGTSEIYIAMEAG